MHDEKGSINELVHLYIDGAFDRRELIRRVARQAGSMAGAMTALGGYDVLNAQPSACPEGVRVPADAPDLVMNEVTFPSFGATVNGYLAYPKQDEFRKLPAIIVMHENRGLVEHIRDVTRRVARANFVALGVDLLSRQGGVANFPDPQQQTAAYNRTTQFERDSDHLAALTFLKTLNVVQHDRMGCVGFCAGGQNSWQFAVGLEELRAAVAFYGAPPTTEQLTGLRAAVLAIYAETDRNLTARVLPTAVSMLDQRRTFALHVYDGVGHAFHNDTGANYNAPAACDAWSKTIGWFNKYVRAG